MRRELPLYKKAKVSAVTHGISLRQWLSEAVREKLEREESQHHVAD